MKILHYTTNTNNMWENDSEKVDKSLYFIFANMINEAENKGYSNVLDGVKMRLTKEEDAYAITLYIINRNDEIPLLETIGCKNVTKNSEIINIIRNVYGIELKKIPLAPFCIDIILPGMALVPNITEWTGDFCRCMAWALLFPEEIR